jgi:hypothetical protein
VSKLTPQQKTHLKQCAEKACGGDNEESKMLYREMVSPAHDTNTPFPPYSFDDVLNMPSKQFLLDQVFGPGDIGMLYGHSGCGKTFVVIDLILKLCTGKRWANRFDVLRPLSVAYCAGEGYGGLPSRFQTATANYGIQELPNFTFFKKVPQLFNAAHPFHAIHFITSWQDLQSRGFLLPLDFLIIDTLHTANNGGDENSSNDMQIIFSNCQLIAQSLGCAVLIIHHANKEGGVRGSNAFTSDCDFVIKIDKAAHLGGTNAFMECQKNKDGEYWKSLNFNLSPLEGYDSMYVTWDVVESDETIVLNKKQWKEKILAFLATYPDRHFTANAIANDIRCDRKKTMQYLGELYKDGKCLRDFKDPNVNKSVDNPWVYIHKN